MAHPGFARGYLHGNRMELIIIALGVGLKKCLEEVRVRHREGFACYRILTIAT
jgi:hypothetical protein